MKILFSILFTIILTSSSFAQNGSISSTFVSQRTDGTGLVDVYFNLDGTESDYYISLEVSFDSGNTFTPIDPAHISGVGQPISPGINKHLIWNGMQTNPNIYSGLSEVKVIANTYPSTVSDYDGNVYYTTHIGGKVWMKENLKTSKYCNGTNIEYGNWDNSNGTYAWYDNNIFWKDSYGALYNWLAVDNTNGLCPNGWHVPSDEEWTALTDYLGGQAIAGGKLKEVGTLHWNSPNAGATNETGYTALPGGYRHSNGSFNSINNYGAWWTSSEHDSEYSLMRSMYSSNGVVGRSMSFKRIIGYSVRCIWNN